MRLILFPLILILAAATRAQVPAVPLIVGDAVAQAVHNNPRLSAALRDEQASRFGVGSARALTNPDITFAPGITSISGSTDELLISQRLELNGTRAARTGVASAQLRATQAQTVVALRNLVFDTKSAYYELARAQERSAVARESLQFAEEFDRVARRQVELGARPGIEATQTGIEVVRARQQVAQAESQETAARAALNTLMGRDPAMPIGSLSMPPLSSPPVNKESIVQQAITSRAEISVEEATRDAFSQEARLARAQGLPDLAPQFRAGSVVRRFSDYGLGIAITLPLVDYGSRRERIRQAEQSAHAQTDRMAAVRNQVRQEVEQALARLRSAEIVLKEYPNGLLAQSLRLLTGSRTGFQEGKTSIISVLEAQRTYRAVQNEYANAQADYALANAELERATGSVSAATLPARGPDVRRPK